MPKLRVHTMSISLDGFAAGPDQTLEQPFGRVDEDRLHGWMFGTAGGREAFGTGTGDTTGVDDEMFRAGTEGIGAWILGRNMFGPVRGPWPDDSWKGWWGDEPSYHCDVFVLTHHARDPQPMEGGTTFHFVTDGIGSALEQAFAAADGKDVRLGGGADVVRQYLRAGLVDEMHLAVVPLLLGAGERIFDDADGTTEALAAAYDCRFRQGESEVTHALFTKRA
jgi:dihydrofolate reductase